MTREIKRLRAILESAIQFIDNKRCDNIPEPIINTATKTFTTAFHNLTGENIVPKDEVCEQLGIGTSHLSAEIRDGKLPTPEPISESRVGIKQKYIDEYKQLR